MYLYIYNIYICVCVCVCVCIERGTRARAPSRGAQRAWKRYVSASVRSTDTPRQVLETPMWVLDTPSQVLETPMRVLDTPRCAQDTPGRVFSHTPGWVVDIPKGVTAGLQKVCISLISHKVLIKRFQKVNSLPNRQLDILISNSQR